MRIIAYADVHWGSPETLEELGFRPAYDNCSKLADVIELNRPDRVISCGDFEERFWDNSEFLVRNIPASAQRLKDLTDIFLLGNHERPFGALDSMVLDSLVFAHMYERGVFVCGHTHKPQVSPSMLDVGSLTLNGTYGEIINGVPYLRTVK